LKYFGFEITAMSRSTIFILLIAALQLNAQNFQFPNTGKPLTLPEMQNSFDSWADTADIGNLKHWKYIKRKLNEWETRTDGQGNPGNPSELFKYRQSRASQKSSAFNGLWSPSGPDYVPENGTGYLENGIGRINCMAFHPSNPQIFWVGVAQGGLWKTEDGGQSWMPLTDNLPITRISDIAVNPQNPDEIYISLCDFAYIGIGLDIDNRYRFAHYGLGVYKTTNGGIDWEPTTLEFSLTDRDASLIRKIIIHPQQTNELVACGVSGMYRSSDAGQTWTTMLDTLFWDLVQDPSQPEVLYAASGWLYNAQTGYAAIYKSVDFGDSWTELPSGIPTTGEVQRIKLAISESNPSIIYAITVDTLSGLYSLYKSLNAGEEWFELPQELNILEAGEGQNQGGQGTYDLVLHVDRENSDLVYAGGVNMYMSENGGISFNPVSHWTLYFGPTVHADQHYFTQHPLTGEYYLCNDGGLYKTNLVLNQPWDLALGGEPWPSQWQNLSNGMQITSFYRLSSSKTNDGRLIAGAQDNATAYFDGNSWRAIFGGDGMDCYLNPFDENFLIGAAQFGVIYQTSDAAMNEFSFLIASDLGENAEWTAPVTGCITQDNTLYIYAGFENVYRSSDWGFTWDLTGLPGSDSQPLTALEVSGNDCEILYATSRINYFDNIAPQIYKSLNGGQSWLNVTNGLPDSLYFTSVAINPENDEEIVLTIGGFAENVKIFRSFNGGLTWQNISFNLPNFPVNRAVFLPSGDHVLLATDGGVFLLEAGSSEWSDQSEGLPNVIVSDIDINHASNKVFISTFGRGIWESNLSNITNIQKLPCKDGIRFNSLGDKAFTIEIPEYYCNSTIASPFTNLEIIDIMGRVVLSKEITQNQVGFSMPESCSSGLYFARLSGKSKSLVHRFFCH
jgi:photosystem II stability/assembly factor-like uncharacterized protein